MAWKGLKILCELGHCLKWQAEEQRSVDFFFQSISVVVQRGNTASIKGRVKANHEDYSDIHV